MDRGKLKSKLLNFLRHLAYSLQNGGQWVADISLFGRCCWVRTQEVRPYLFISDGIFLWAHLDQISFFCSTESNHQGYGLKLIFLKGFHSTINKFSRLNNLIEYIE